MRKSIFIVTTLFLLGLSSGINAQVLRGEGKIITDIRELSGFNEIVAQGQFSLIITQGEKENIRIETFENLMELFQTRIEGKRLYITMLADVKNSNKNNVYISIKELTSIVLLDEVELKTETVVHFDELNIFSGGMSRIDMELFAASLTIELTDGTYGLFKGYSEKFYAEIHDETEMNAFEMQTDFTTIRSTGLTEVMIDVQKELKLLVTGGSNVYYTGEPVVSERIFSSTGFIVKRKRNNP